MCTAERIRIITADDHPFLRAGIVAAIEMEEDMQVVAEASTGREAIERFHMHQPDVMLLDVQMPDLNGIDVMTTIRSDFPAARIVILTTFEGDILARRALKAGASGFILKNTLRKELTDIIRSVHAGNKHIPAQVATGLAQRFHDEDLTAREIEVLRAASQGRSNKKIGEALLISEETVKAHMKSILLKLSVSDRTHAMAVATARGILM